MKEIILKEKELRKLKRLVRKYKYDDNTYIKFQYNNKLYNKPSKEVDKYKKYLEVIEAFNIKDRRKRISYIYDYLCNYFDEDMKKHNYCEFKDGTCIANRLGYSVHEDNGCCYQFRKGLCKHLTPNGCSSPNPSCKIFMCEYLAKYKKVSNYDTRKVYLTKCLFSFNEHAFFRRQYFITKKEYLDKYFKIVKV
ncbi:MAG: hypothetical protein VZS44_03180 [Bacilli bacterium]|nr:hypothetical protein [Bacilli bacterium]